jgi:hypothetical protein
MAAVAYGSFRLWTSNQRRMEAQLDGQASDVRWELLFDDLEAQLEADQAAELAGEVRERVRAEQARLRIVDRLRGSVGRELDVALRGGQRERGLLRRVGADWVLLEPAPGRESLIPLRAMLTIGGLGPRSTEPGSEGLVAARLVFGQALRSLTRDRSRVRLLLDDGTALMGVLSRVGADFLEIEDDPGRAAGGRLVRAGAVSAVRREAGGALL